ncbi:MAG TPA: helix-turn-helix transcriptional regulator [Pseudonocardia sp.]|uniref:helix-turn-helix domain-containing protein n=1 Tax=Pseudonocardia sp. TaxID=60912 RepID=UPI002F4189AD
MSELGRFLRDRRGRRAPEVAGVAGGGTRRRDGLRREELALLAGVSADYLARLEQGRANRPSPAVLNALAGALGLGEHDRTHLFTLVNREYLPVRDTAEADRPTARIGRMLDALPGPAWLVNHRLDVLAWNEACAAVFTDWARLPPTERNLARFLFLDPAARELYADWPTYAHDFIGKLRAAAARWPDDLELGDLVAALGTGSTEFRAWWADYDVVQPGGGSLVLRHPSVGELRLGYEVMFLAGPGERRLVVADAEPGSESADRLRRLLAEKPEQRASGR